MKKRPHERKAVIPSDFQKISPLAYSFGKRNCRGFLALPVMIFLSATAPSYTLLKMELHQRRSSKSPCVPPRTCPAISLSTPLCACPAAPITREAFDEV